jgi:hypothetical protein
MDRIIDNMFFLEIINSLIQPSLNETDKNLQKKYLT